MHLAAAVGTPVVEVSCHPRGGDPEHHNAPERFGPWETDAVVVRPDAPLAPCRGGCSSDVAHCILGVTVDAVTAAAHALLDRAQTERSPAAVGSAR
jgi:hypothetical protein